VDLAIISRTAGPAASSRVTNSSRATMNL